jgi:saccharopine dehydrogenase-like NADP-dependent oxidoreductase
MSKATILIAGAGGIGRSVALILAEWSAADYTICLGDANADTLVETLEWLRASTTKEAAIFQGFEIPYEGENEALLEALKKGAIILDCLPGQLAPRIAQYALDYGLHYANLTEYVEETEQITQLAKNSKQGFVLQTGLAPGFINILGKRLYERFCTEQNTKKADRMLMAVGALTQTALPPHYYGFTWSPIGVATEYLEAANALRDFQMTNLPALSEREALLVDGRQYELDITSGGAADLPSFLEGRVQRLDYKTIRYPGHYDWVQTQIKQLQQQDKLSSEALQQIMEATVPRVEDDLVVVYCSVSGKNDKGELHQLEQYYHIYPAQVGKTTLRAIQVTTASPLAQIAENLLSGNIQGSYFQSQIDTNAFFEGTFVKKMIEQS